MENKEINWYEIIDDVFFNNYVKGDPSKFLNKLETVLKEKGYRGPIIPIRPDHFGGPPDEARLLRNFLTNKLLKKDRVDRPLDRYIMQDILVDKFFNGNQDAAGKFYQEWLKTRGDYVAHKEWDGSDSPLFNSINDVPIWTPNDDVVSDLVDKVYLSYLFGGKYYTSYEEQDKHEEHAKNKAEGKGRDVCPQLR